MQKDERSNYLALLKSLDSAHIDASMSRAAQQKLERLADFQFVERFNGEKPGRPVGRSH
nr:hypothetical protein [Bacillus pumilus]